MSRQPPYSTLFPYTTLFRSLRLTIQMDGVRKNGMVRLLVRDPKQIAVHGSPEAVFGCGVQRPPRSEEHTSELQSHSDLVCRLLLEKKKKKNIKNRLEK